MRPGVVMIRLWLVLLPELRQFPAGEQDKALHTARNTELEPLELIGIAAWLVPVVMLSKYLATRAAMSDELSATLSMNIVVAVPLLALVFAPIHIRRLRRGLRNQLARLGRM